ncbi:MAG: PQQ-binding-like beta-propeller repeat protein [Chitinophagaceae bacterium]|nr:PQQ-binding-like beta-propeller repeat protein [Bauldia sp.]MCW5929949.1 PQQ-binding-like beta-propeller repeat protein [Chitinophagaceae bacterium]
MKSTLRLLAAVSMGCMASTAALAQPAAPAPAATTAAQLNVDQTARRDQIFANWTTVTDEMLRNPSPNDWLMLRGNYEMWGYSTLDQINRDNINSLTLVWARAMGTGQNEGVPLVHDGIMILPNPWDQVQAIDAASGDLIWQYTRGEIPTVDWVNGPLRTSWGQRQRSVALYEDMIFMATSDAHIVALDVKSGQVLWDTPTGGDGYAGNSSGPIVVNGIVITGSTCQVAEFGCWVTGHDAATGEELWRNEVIPRPGEPGDETWAGVPFESRWCTGVWGQITYDPVTNLVNYGSTGNCPAPDVQRGVVGMNATNAGTNERWTIRPETGEVVWRHQVLPQDNWDQECTFDMMVIPTVVNPNPNAEGMYAANTALAGSERRTLTGMPCKTAVIWSFDMETGEFIYARQTWDGATNLYESIDAVTGVPTLNPETIMNEAGGTIFFCPTYMGGRDWPSGAYDPVRNIMIQPTRDRCTESTSRTDREPAGNFLYNTQNVTVANPNLPQGEDYPGGRITAVNVETGDTFWQHTMQDSNYSPVLITAGGLVFNGNADRYFFAVDIDTGERIWQTRLGSGISGYMSTYAIDGRQYVAVVAGQNSNGNNQLSPAMALTDNVSTANMVYVFALPE